MKSTGSYKFILLLSLAGVALYGQFLWNPIVFDDIDFFLLNESGRQPIDDYRFTLFELRSLPYATFAWTRSIFGLSMLHFRVENLLLHILVAVTLFRFLMEIFSTVLKERTAQQLSINAVAFSASILYLLHPVAVYAVGYLIQRSILMATLFSILSMWSYMRGTLSGNQKWLWGSAFLYFLAVSSKEHAIMLPAVLFSLTVLLHLDWKAKIKERWLLWAVFMAIAIWVVLARKGVLGTTYERYALDMLPSLSRDANFTLSILTQMWLFFKYILLWLFPNPTWMSVDMREPFATSFWSAYLVAFVAYLSWGGLSLWLLFKRGRLGLLGFALLFPWLMFWTEFSTVRVQESFVLYRSYIWGVGACALLPLLIDQLEKRTAIVLICAVVLAMFPISMDRLVSFSHPLVLWDDASKLVQDNKFLPGAYRIYYNRGTEYLKLKNYNEAISDLKIATQLYPEWPYSYYNLGVAYLGGGEWQKAIEIFSRGIEIRDSTLTGVNPKPYFGRAMAYESLGKLELAQRDYRFTCEIANKGCEKLKQFSHPSSRAISDFEKRLPPN